MVVFNKFQVNELTTEIGETAQKLLESFVHSSGVSLSRMIRTSIEARDWLKCVEPRQVRAVMRRVVEEVTQTDQQVRECDGRWKSNKTTHNVELAGRLLVWGGHEKSTQQRQQQAHLYPPKFFVTSERTASLGLVRTQVGIFWRFLI